MLLPVSIAIIRSGVVAVEVIEYPEIDLRSADSHVLA
jgi:hypothetical protein